MKTLERLVNAKKNISLGNHKVELDGKYRNFFYHWTVVCRVDDEGKTFVTNRGGWGTRSTTRVINWYRKYFADEGYRYTKDDLLKQLDEYIKQNKKEGSA